MVNEDGVEDDDSTFDDIEIFDDREILGKITKVKHNSEARRRLENVLEDKVLERLINDDFYDQD